MKNYDLEHYNDLRDLTVAIACDLIENLDGNKAYGNFADGEICGIEGIMEGPLSPEFRIEISARDGFHTFNLRHAIEAGSLTFDESTNECLRAYFEPLDAAVEKKTVEYLKTEALNKERYRKAAEDREKAKAAAAEKKAQLEEEKKLRECNARFARAIELTFPERLRRPHMDEAELSALAADIEWLADHVGAIEAIVSEDYLGWFRKHFGEAPVKVKSIDSCKGKSKVSFSMEFANADGMPESVSNKLKAKAKRINDIPYIWGLIKDYGFCFGDSQDADSIKSCI